MSLKLFPNVADVAKSHSLFVEDVFEKQSGMLPAFSKSSLYGATNTSHNVVNDATEDQSLKSPLPQSVLT